MLGLINLFVCFNFLCSNLVDTIGDMSSIGEKWSQWTRVVKKRSRSWNHASASFNGSACFIQRRWLPPRHRLTTLVLGHTYPPPNHTDTCIHPCSWSWLRIWARAANDAKDPSCRTHFQLLSFNPLIVTNSWICWSGYYVR